MSPDMECDQPLIGLVEKGPAADEEYSTFTDDKKSEERVMDLSSPESCSGLPEDEYGKMADGTLFPPPPTVDEPLPPIYPAAVNISVALLLASFIQGYFPATAEECRMPFTSSVDTFLTLGTRVLAASMTLTAAASPAAA